MERPKVVERGLTLGQLDPSFCLNDYNFSLARWIEFDYFSSCFLWVKLHFRAKKLESVGGTFS